MSKLSLPIILQLVGIAVVIAEIILPSGGLLSLIAIGLFGYSLYIVFTEFSVTLGMLFVAADIISIPILVLVGIKMLARSKVTLRKTLASSEGVSSQSPGLREYAGREGRTLTDLRPAGLALIDGRRTDVVSRGEYIEKDTEIVVHLVSGNQIVVRKK